MSDLQRIHLTQQRSPTPAGPDLEYAIGHAVEGPAVRPVVLGLHFGWRGAISPRMGRDFLRLLVEPALADSGALLVGPTCPARSWHEPRAVAALLRLLDELAEQWPGAAEPVTVVGYSLGGMGAWFLAAHHPERVAAAIALAALPVLRVPPEHDVMAEYRRVAAGGAVPWYPGLARVPVRAIHSRDDEVVPWEPLAVAVESLKQHGADVQLELLEGLGHYEAARYGPALRRQLPWLRGIWRARGAEAAGAAS